jgi:hypothetical protein
MKKFKLLLVYLFLPFLTYSQEWQKYSDSVYTNYKKNDIEKATHFIELAEKELLKNKVIQDTIYADFIYRKGIVNNFKGDYETNLFNQSLAIWQKSTKKNFEKIMKIHYFLGVGYETKKDFKNSYVHFETCYLINKQHNIKSNSIYQNSLFFLAQIDYQENFNFKKAELYANEYILNNKETAYLNFDFNFAYAFRWKEDSKGYENVLLDFNNNYENKNLNNTELYFQINYLLFDYYRKQIFYYKQNKNDELIKYGEKAIEIQNKLNKKNDAILQGIYLELTLAYSEKKDEVNKKKYNDLMKKRIF